MEFNTDKYTIAILALWAGDFGYFEELLKALPQRSNIKRKVTSKTIIQGIGALRLRQFRQRRGEFRKFTAEYFNKDMEFSELPLILETKHLRAAIWRTGIREFLMQAYLKDLSWEKQLFENIQRLNSVDNFKVPQKRLGRNFTLVGNPFLQGELSDMGLLEIAALWIGPKLPENSEPIITPLKRVLGELDEE